jgi:hypothetical protein
VHQCRLRRQQPEHAPASEPEAHRSRDAIADHARPFYTRGKNLHREVQALIVQATVQQAESSASRIRQ